MSSISFTVLRKCFQVCVVVVVSVYLASIRTVIDNIDGKPNIVSMNVINFIIFLGPEPNLHIKIYLRL